MKNLSAEAQKQVAITFESNPGVDEFHVTTDGLCFTDEGEAINHGFSLTHGVVEDDENGGMRKLQDHEKIAIREVVKVAREELTTSKLISVTVTQEMLDLNSELIASGVTVGEIIEIEPLTKKELDGLLKAATKAKKDTEIAAKIAAKKAAKKAASKAEGGDKKSGGK